MGFEKESLVGIIRFEPVEVIKIIHRRGKPKGEMPRYFKASVVRSRTTIDQKASGYEWEDESKVCPECLYDGTLKRYKRVVIDQKTWMGEDIFFPRGGRALIVSERFRSLFAEYDLIGAIFIPSESDEAGYDSFPWETEVNQS